VLGLNEEFVWRAIEKGVAEAIAKIVAENKFAEQIAAMLGWDEEIVRRAMKSIEKAGAA
jgi:hypothetical protein